MTDETHDPSRSTRRKILRRATLYVWAFLGAAVGVALAGAAFVAFLLTRRGWPFVQTWLIIAAIIVLPGLAAAIWNLVRGR